MRTQDDAVTAASTTMSGATILTHVLARCRGTGRSRRKWGRLWASESRLWLTIAAHDLNSSHIFVLPFVKVYSPPSSQLFYKNGQPFPAHRPVGLRVNITHIELALDIPVTQEVLQEPESNVVKVAFTVRKAGRYEVAVKLGGLNVAYSPYYKIFQPGNTNTSVWGLLCISV